MFPLQPPIRLPTFAVRVLLPHVILVPRPVLIPIPLRPIPLLFPWKLSIIFIFIFALELKIFLSIVKRNPRFWVRFPQEWSLPVLNITNKSVNKSVKEVPVAVFKILPIPTHSNHPPGPSGHPQLTSETCETLPPLASRGNQRAMEPPTSTQTTLGTPATRWPPWRPG